MINKKISSILKSGGTEAGKIVNAMFKDINLVQQNHQVYFIEKCKNLNTKNKTLTLEKDAIYLNDDKTKDILQGNNEETTNEINKINSHLEKILLKKNEHDDNKSAVESNIDEKNKKLMLLQQDIL
ncbi:MAG: hypothetical protein GY820_20005 [Gammaproteobacteria bacterium]|nr:hypothetical protein [Gammaproteobacteria bacterium]